MEKYLYDGTCVDLIQELKNGKYLVSCIFVNDDGEYSHNGEPVVVDAVFDEPVTKKMSDSVERLKSEIGDLILKRSDAEKELQESQRKLEEFAKRVQNVDSLSRIFDYVDGKITHYVTLEKWGEDKILSFDDTLCEYGNKRNFRLLSLMASKTYKEKVEWKLNLYSDGSGGDLTVFPCTSFEEAKERLTAHILSKKPSESGIATAQKYDIVLPKEYFDKVTEEKKASHKKELKDAKRKFDKSVQEYTDKFSESPVLE